MKKITKIVTYLVIPLLIALVLVYDVIAIFKGGTEASISSIIITMAYEFPLLPYLGGFFTGLLAGHFFWRMRTNEDTKEIDG